MMHKTFCYSLYNYKAQKYKKYRIFALNIKNEHIMYYIRTYPLSIITIIVIWYLSFFTPPQTELNNVPFIDKIVHICMYGGLTMVIWFEYLRLHKFIVWKKLITGGIILPIFMSGCIELLQAACTDNRSGDWLDFLANSLGVGLALLVSYYILRPIIKRFLQK